MSKKTSTQTRIFLETLLSSAELARSPNQFGGLENHPDLLQDAEVAQTWGKMIWVLQLV